MTRKIDLAKIHIGAAELGWRSVDDDAEYRRQLFAVCRVQSAAELDEAGRQRFLSHLRQCGWHARKSAAAKLQRASTQATTEQLQLIRHLWGCLARSGEIVAGDETALRRWIRGQTKGKADALEFLDRWTARALTERLKKWCGRLDLDWRDVG
jgi:phage gp16-like protein